MSESRGKLGSAIGTERKSWTIQPGEFRKDCTEKLHWTLRVNKNVQEEYKEHTGKRISILKNKKFIMFRDKCIIMKLHKIIHKPTKKLDLYYLLLEADIYFLLSLKYHPFFFFIFMLSWEFLACEWVNQAFVPAMYTFQVLSIFCVSRQTKEQCGIYSSML